MPFSTNVGGIWAFRTILVDFRNRNTDSERKKALEARRLRSLPFLATSTCQFSDFLEFRLLSRNWSFVLFLENPELASHAKRERTRSETSLPRETSFPGLPFQEIEMTCDQPHGLWPAQFRVWDPRFLGFVAPALRVTTGGGVTLPCTINKNVSKCWRIWK